MLGQASQLANGYLDDKQRPWIAPPSSLPLYASGDTASKYAGIRTFISTIKSQAAHYLRPAGALRASSSPSNVKFVFMCALWYASSALSSNTGKTILNQFRYPITLTFIQFGFVASYCLLFMSRPIQFSQMRMPTKAILKSTIPMGMFQVGGHVFSSMAMSTIPVSTVHTIKVSAFICGARCLIHMFQALSPLITVVAYALLFGVSYSSKTYISLLPLTLGVMLACSFDISASNYIGLLCAFGSALVFVSSNIFFKKIMPSGQSQSSGSKLDKLNLLLYSSGFAFILMIPIWVWTDLPALLSTPDHIVHPSHSHTRSYIAVAYHFFLNGTVHFAQNIIAFIILSSTSPVTYSIASLIKRVAVICIAIVWFSQSVHPIQAFGIGLTFTGLYMYNNAKSDVERGEKKMRRVEAAKDMMLPTTTAESAMMAGEGESTGMGESTGTIAARIGRARAPTIPHLSVKITPPLVNVKPASPMDSYPSPPPSIDSPPYRVSPLPIPALA